MALAPIVELHLNPKHSFSPHQPFHSNLPVSPSITFNRSIINNSNLHQTTGTFFVVLCCVLV